MMVEIKQFSTTLNEEIKYFENADQYSKSLEATLWGLEQQAQYPENSSKQDQDALADEINKIRVKLQSVKRLLEDHEQKVYGLIMMFANARGCSSGGCVKE